MYLYIRTGIRIQDNTLYIIVTPLYCSVATKNKHVASRFTLLWCFPWPADHDVQGSSRPKMQGLTTSVLPLLVHWLDFSGGDEKKLVVSCDER